jgi:hypothetical protein
MKLPKELQKYHEPLESLQKLISQFNHRGVVIGGIAASVLGEARYTEDLDAIFLLSTQEITKFLEAAKQEGVESSRASIAICEIENFRDPHRKFLVIK